MSGRALMLSIKLYSKFDYMKSGKVHTRTHWGCLDIDGFMSHCDI